MGERLRANGVVGVGSVVAGLTEVVTGDGTEWDVGWKESDVADGSGAEGCGDDAISWCGWNPLVGSDADDVGSKLSPLIADVLSSSVYKPNNN